ncbi:hypothetical protein [Embleya sp. NPDC005971]|uniref:hypothetical protein n=1 Tax=Embleya sp. NPDC005971 TaxID=3156724 RepID=UPI0034092DF3
MISIDTSTHHPHTLPGTMAATPNTAGRFARWCLRRRRTLIPGLTTTALAGLARYWHYTGAAHDIGAASLLGSAGMLALTGAYVSATGRNSTPGITAAATTAGATCTIGAVAAYVDPWQPVAFLWAAGTVAAYTAYGHTHGGLTEAGRPDTVEITTDARLIAARASAETTARLMEAWAARAALPPARAVAIEAPAAARAEPEIIDAEIIETPSEPRAIRSGPETEPPAFG